MSKNVPSIISASLLSAKPRLGKLKDIRFEERLITAYEKIVSKFGKEVQESLEEIGRELQLIAKLGNFSFSFNGQDKSDERNFFRIGGGILGLAGVVMGFIPPLFVIGLIVGIVGSVISLIGGFFKSRHEKRREAVENISSALQRQIKEARDHTLSKALEQLDKTCDEVEVNIDKYFKELLEGLDLEFRLILLTKPLNPYPERLS